MKLKFLLMETKKETFNYMTVQWWYILMKKNTAETEDRETEVGKGKPAKYWIRKELMVKQHLKKKKNPKEGREQTVRIPGRLAF